MNIKALANLIKNDANIELIVTRSENGFVMRILDADKPFGLDKNSCDYLELGHDWSDFSTLDSVYNLTKKHLRGKKFTVI
jgi:hypothetical protein